MTTERPDPDPAHDGFPSVARAGKAVRVGDELAVALGGRIHRYLLVGADPSTVPAVIVDVDGTVADMGKGQPGRRHFADWDRVAEDTPIWPVIALVAMFRIIGYRIIFVSGRDERCRDVTWSWLRAHGAVNDGDLLFMRPTKDGRPDEVVKAEIYDREIDGRFDVRYVVDDRNKVVKMWRARGLTVLQVADGDF